MPELNQIHTKRAKRAIGDQNNGKIVRTFNINARFRYFSIDFLLCFCDAGELVHHHKQGQEGQPGRNGREGKQGVPGPQGIEGDVGEKGIQGLPGDSGWPGEEGNTGSKGEIGDEGLVGIRGQHVMMGR
ncbi:Gliomedin [Dirofilaria immitis]|nr:Gliomedin [Dirofilaria immitis]